MTKKYSAKDIKVLDDHIGFIKKRSDIFLGFNHKDVPYKHTVLTLLERTVGVATLCKASPIITDIYEDLYIVSSQTNWFYDENGNTLKIEELFDRVIQTPEEEIQFSVRTELIIKALCNNIAILKNKNCKVIKGKFPKDTLEIFKTKYPNSYAIIFN